MIWLTWPTQAYTGLLQRPQTAPIENSRNNRSYYDFCACWLWPMSRLNVTLCIMYGSVTVRGSYDSRVVMSNYCDNANTKLANFSTQIYGIPLGSLTGCIQKMNSLSNRSYFHTKERAKTDPFTTLHCMQRGLGDHKAVCLSVCSSVRTSIERVNCDKTKAPSEKKFSYH